MVIKFSLVHIIFVFTFFCVQLLVWQKPSTATSTIGNYNANSASFTLRDANTELHSDEYDGPKGKWKERLDKFNSQRPIPCGRRLVNRSTFQRKNKGTRREKSGNSHRISNGREAKPGMFPSFVGLQMFNDSPSSSQFDYTYCSGVLISENLVLTAAHCLAKPIVRVATTGIHPYQWRRHKLKFYNGEKKCLSKYTTSQDYTQEPNQTYHDYGILRLSEKVEFNNYVQTACLPTGKIDQNEQVIMIGVGSIGTDPQTIYPITPKYLQFLSAKYIDCPKKHRHKSHICFVANDAQHFGDSCKGDSGGPILVCRGNKSEIIALHSYTLRGDPKTCVASPNTEPNIKSDVFRNLDDLLDLIDQCS